VIVRPVDKKTGTRFSEENGLNITSQVHVRFAEEPDLIQEINKKHISVFLEYISWIELI